MVGSQSQIGFISCSHCRSTFCPPTSWPPILHQTTAAAAFFHPFYRGDINPRIVENNSQSRLTPRPVAALSPEHKYGQNIFGAFNLEKKKMSNNALALLKISLEVHFTLVKIVLSPEGFKTFNNIFPSQGFSPVPLSWWSNNRKDIYYVKKYLQ